MNILFFASRLAGTDGVSLEAAKMRLVLERQGHKVSYCAGELDPDHAGEHLVPEMHFNCPVAQALGRRAFEDPSAEDPSAVPTLEEEIFRRADAIVTRLLSVVAATKPDLAVVQNAWAIPMQLPLAVALARLVDQLGLPVISHNHDYWWERERFSGSKTQSILDQYFPFAGPKIIQLCINSEAQRELKRKRGLDSLLLPNVLEFERPPSGIDSFNSDFRQAIGLEPGRPLVLQPTRVVPRKGIEHAIELVAQLADLQPSLVITHEAGDEGLDYLHELQQLAKNRGVDLRYVASIIGDARRSDSQGKTYSLWDAYPHADFVTYPSLYEGFGNALLEAVWFQKPVLVNRYSVYVQDIAPTGFRFVEIDGQVTDPAVSQVRTLLTSAPASDATQEMTEHNYTVAVKHFGFGALQMILTEAMKSLSL